VLPLVELNEFFRRVRVLVWVSKVLFEFEVSIFEVLVTLLIRSNLLHQRNVDYLSGFVFW
jgi:hypothetical protein